MGWLDSRAQYDRRGWGKVVVGVVGPFDRHAAKRLSHSDICLLKTEICDARHEKCRF